MEEVEIVVRNFSNVHGEALRVEVRKFSKNATCVLVDNTDQTDQKKTLLHVSFLMGGLYIIVLVLGIPVASIIGHIMMIFMTAFLLFAHFTTVESESITIIKQMGIQEKISYSKSRTEERMIPSHSIYDLVINEAILRQKVIFLMQVLQEPEGAGNAPMFTLFQNTLPDRSCLEFIYEQIYKVIDKSR
ncbi:hypothetical protein DMENIID0001_074880 [Sergentomyia squamirostris]